MKWCASWMGLVVLIAGPARGDDRRPDFVPPAQAVTGARVVIAPGRVFESGTVVIRGGVIEAVGPSDQVKPPFDAEVIDGKGLTVTAGFLDLASTLGVPKDAPRGRTEPGRPVPYEEFAYPRTPPDNRAGITPDFRVADWVDLGEAAAGKHRALGFTDVVAAPGGAIASGQSALVSLTGRPRREAVLASPIALHIALASPYGRAFSEGHDHSDEAMADGPPGGANPLEAVRRTSGGYPGALMGVVAHLRQAMLDSEHHQSLLASQKAMGGGVPPFDPALEALAAARGRTLPSWWEANTRDEIHRALDLADEFGTTCVIVGGREADKVVDRLKATGTPVILRLDLPEEPKVPTEEEYRKKPEKEREEPLRALEEKARKWKERAAVAHALADAGVPFAFTTEGLAKPEEFPEKVRKLIAAGLSAEGALAALTTQAAEIAGQSKRLGSIEPGKLGHIVAFTGPLGDEKAKFRFALVDGMKFEDKKDAQGPKKDRPEDKKDEEKKPDEKEAEKKPGEEKEKPKAEPTKDQAPPKPPDAAPFVDVSTETDADRKPWVRTNGNVLIRGVTILTVTRGTIPKGSILIRDGKIAEIGPDIAPPEGFAVIEADGLVAMPGIIDTHSHMAIQGGVNEATLSIVPEVRVKDVVTGDDVAIYRALAGGTTSARLLHGSANTIGGQDAVIKMKYGKAGHDLILRDGPQGVKFALGENVTRNRSRFPTTRMGVEATLVRAFEEARSYKAQWQDYGTRLAAGERIPPPRRDLRLEALASILDGKIRIHSHCYRSDEILMLLRTAERFGIRVQSLQHVLEGYKIAPEIAAHGASCSTFSDWWAYKIEAFDAIPFNAALLAKAGVSVCIKSDSEELVRHLNLETAKMVRYGGVSEEQALAMVTINPARELGLSHRIGSIEVGKDADITLFNAHPLDGFARCELTLIDGEVCFRREKAGRLAARPGDHSKMPIDLLESPPDPLPPIPTAANGTYALVGATVHPVGKPEIPKGVVIVSNGTIQSVGGVETPIPAGAVSIDLAGRDLWPGMIDAGGAVGILEIGSIRETQDGADSASFQPELRTAVAINPESELIPVTRLAGVLATLIQPRGGTIAGQACVANLAGWVPPEMVIAEEAVLCINIPHKLSEERIRQIAVTNPGIREQVDKRKELMEKLADQFRKALAFESIVKEARSRGTMPPSDPRLEALIPYAKGERPVLFRANSRAEILDALQLIKDLKLKGIIGGGADAWKVAGAIKEAGVPVILEGTLKLPAGEYDPYDSPYAAPAKLKAAGIPFAIRSAGSGTGSDEATSSRNLPFEAATAVAYGLDEASALEAVTLSPARILGVEGKLGSIEPGKLANLVITTGHLLQPTARMDAYFIAGKPLAPESKHTRLFEKYSRRLSEVQAGVAPLGLNRPRPPAPPAPAAPGPLSTGDDAAKPKPAEPSGGRNE